MIDCTGRSRSTVLVFPPTETDIEVPSLVTCTRVGNQSRRRSLPTVSSVARNASRQQASKTGRRHGQMLENLAARGLRNTRLIITLGLHRHYGGQPVRAPPPGQAPGEREPPGLQQTVQGVGDAVDVADLVAVVGRDWPLRDRV